MTIARVVFSLALAVWLGTVVFLSFVVAPTVFGAFPREEAGRVMGTIFPRYYMLQAVTGTIALAASALLWMRMSPRPWRTVTIATALMLTAAVYAGAVIQPQTQVLRIQLHTTDPSADTQSRFDTLHRRAVQLNSAVLLLGIGCIAATTRGERRRDARST